MKRLRFLLVLILLSSSLHAQKFADAYKKGNYEKSLELSQKAIDKDPKNLDAYLIKALSNMHLGIDSTTSADHGFAVESALTTLTFLIGKDKQHIFIDAHQPEVDSILEAGYGKASAYYGDNKNSKAEKILEKLIGIQPRPEYYYLQGRMINDDGDITAAIKMFNTAAGKIYIDAKNGIEHDAWLSEVFIELANALYFDGDDNSGNITFNRALQLYKSQEIEDAYYSALENALTGYFDFTEPAQYQSYIDNLDTIGDLIQDKEKFSALKWKMINMYYAALTYQKMDAEADSLLYNYACSEQHREAYTLLLKEVVTKTRIKNSETNPELVHAREQTHTLLRLYQCLNGRSGGVELLFPYIDSLISVNQFTNAFRLLYNLKLISTDTKKVAAYEDKIFQNIKTADDTLISYIDLFELIQFFPNNKNFKSLQKNSAINVIAKLIEEKKFSKAGDMLRLQMATYPKDATLLTLYKQWVIQDYLINYIGSSTWENPVQWNGSVETCNPGKLSEADQKIFLQRLNYVRRLAGVPDKCVLNETWNKKCQAAALMMTANYSLSHFPPKDWKCYTEDGREGAGHSNLSLGDNSTDALMGQVDDDGGNNESVGHRRWILNPYRRVFGHGSSSSAMALWALGGPDSDYPDSITQTFDTKFVAWPPAYFCPAPFYTARWSFSLTGADFEETKVEMTSGSQKIECTLLPLGYGYGQSTLVWEPDITWNSIENATYTVTLKNVRFSYWDEKAEEWKYTPRDYTYTTTFLPVR